MRIFLIVIISLFCFLLEQNAYAQIDHQKAHRRYWYYRTRLINDFMKIGKGQGESIVLAERNLNSSTEVIQPISKVGPDQIDIINQYMIVLALEYKMLSRANQSTAETVNELYHLLYMINRIDMEADQFWGDNPPTSPTISPTELPNGFMIREDVPKDFLVQNEYHFNYEKQLNNGSNNGFCGTPFTKDLDGGKFQEYVVTPNSGEKDEMGMPHDKFHSMLSALMFITKYIPDGVTNGSETFQDGASSIKQEAKNMADRIYTYLKGHNSTWLLAYPDNSVSSPHLLNVGAVANIYSWPLSRMACYTNDNFPWSSIKPCFTYDDATVLSIGRPFYQTFSQVPQYPKDAAVFMAWDQAGSNRHSIIPTSVINSITGVGVPLPAYTAMTPNTAVWNLKWAELLRKVLHQNGTLLTQLSVYENALAKAPCNGPYSYSIPGSSNYEYASLDWSSPDRNEHPDRMGNAHGFPGNYPGVDYMLLHNLYYEYNNQLMEEHNGNVATWGNGGGVIGTVTTFVYNAANVVANTVVTGVCNAANTVAGWFGGSVDCSNVSTEGGNGGVGSNVSVTPYLPYNLMDNTDMAIWPREMHHFGGLINTTEVYGIDGKPAYVKVYQNLVSGAHIYANSSPNAPTNTIPSNVEYRAGKEITLVDGFTVEAGSTFHAYVERYLCTGANDDLYLRKKYDSTASSNFMSYEEDGMNLIPIHYETSQLSASDLTPVINDSLDYESLGDTIPYADPSTQRSASFKNQTKAKTQMESVGDDIVIVPNPNEGEFEVKVPLLEDKQQYNLIIVDMKGSEIYNSKSEEKNLKINLSSHNKGIYAILVVSSNGKVFNKRVIVQ